MLIAILLLIIVLCLLSYFASNKQQESFTSMKSNQPASPSVSLEKMEGQRAKDDNNSFLQNNSAFEDLVVYENDYTTGLLGLDLCAEQAAANGGTCVPFGEGGTTTYYPNSIYDYYTFANINNASENPAEKQAPLTGFQSFPALQ